MNTRNLFENKERLKFRPLACRLRPSTLSSFKGQSHLVGPGKRLRKMIDSGLLYSVIFWGPPGCGKTALAGIIADGLKARVKKINAVNSSVAEIRDIIGNAKLYIPEGKRTLLIVDEIHRFAKNQQESLLPDVEEGNITLIGITTENPNYFISGPLLSRTAVYKFLPLDNESIISILENALNDTPNGYGKDKITASEEALKLISSHSAGDARYALNILELAVETLIGKSKKVTAETVKSSIGSERVVYDRSGDSHYDNISALIKSMRGSDPDASLYYLARMTAGGDDPVFIARRIVIAASEDIGNADPRALLIAEAALSAVEKVGMPEARIILAQAVTYLASAPKSNSACRGINEAEKFCRESSSGIPEHLTAAGRKNYLYPHNYKYGYVKQKYMEEEAEFYRPVNRGYEKNIKKYLEFIRNIGKS